MLMILALWARVNPEDALSVELVLVFMAVQILPERQNWMKWIISFTV